MKHKWKNPKDEYIERDLLTARMLFAFYQNKVIKQERKVLMNENIISKIRELCENQKLNADSTLAKIYALTKRADYPDFSTIKDGDHFKYAGLEWVRLGREGGGILCVVAKALKDRPFDTDNNNDWRNSSLRTFLNTEFVKIPDLDLDAIIPYTSDLIADNGDTRYGKCEDKVFILSCDLIRKYRKVLPKWNTWVWTLTPWYINDSGHGSGVRYVDTSGALYSSYANYANGVAPACIFIENL